MPISPDCLMKQLRQQLRQERHDYRSVARIRFLRRLGRPGLNLASNKTINQAAPNGGGGVGPVAGYKHVAPDGAGGKPFHRKQRRTPRKAVEDYRTPRPRGVRETLASSRQRVPQTSSLLCRGFPIRRAGVNSVASEMPTPCRLEVGDTRLPGGGQAAGWKPAAQPRGFPTALGLRTI